MKFGEFFVWLTAFVAAIIMGFWVFTTYTAKSISLGEYQQVSENLVFLIQSPTIVMSEDTTDATGKTYTVEREFLSVYQVDKTFDAEKYNYEFNLNGRCFASSNFAYGKFTCSLNTTFVDNDNQDLITDTLTIIINFNSGSTVLKITTNGGAEANKYWFSYFNSYGFDLRVYRLGGEK